MKLIYFKSSSAFLFIAIFVLSCMIWIAAGSVGKPEKIFRHDRLDSDKLARIDLDNEEIQRALEDLRRRVPEYTGYLFVDVIFEIFKMLFISLLKLVGQQQDAAAATAVVVPK